MFPFRRSMKKADSCPEVDFRCWERTTGTCFRIQRNAWLDSGCTFAHCQRMLVDEIYALFFTKLVFFRKVDSILKSIFVLVPQRRDFAAFPAHSSWTTENMNAHVDALWDALKMHARSPEKLTDVSDGTVSAEDGLPSRNITTEQRTGS